MAEPGFVPYAHSNICLPCFHARSKGKQKHAANFRRGQLIQDGKAALEAIFCLAEISFSPLWPLLGSMETEKDNSKGKHEGERCALSNAVKYSARTSASVGPLVLTPVGIITHICLKAFGTGAASWACSHGYVPGVTGGRVFTFLSTASSGLGI